MRYTTRPISDRTPFTGKHKPTPFRAKWSDTLEVLGVELKALGASNVVIEVDTTENAIRLDGMLYANAKVASPAVRLAFDSRHGPLVYATDRYVGRYYEDAADWQQNVRAIALGLEALRRVDRYGITQHGEQYTGWKAIEATPAGMGRDAALQVIAQCSAELPGHYAHDHDMARYRANPDEIRRDWRKARALTHPDRHDGDRTAWDRVEQAAAVLGLDS